MNKLGVTWWKISQASVCSNPQRIPGQARGESPVLFNLPPSLLANSRKALVGKENHIFVTLIDGLRAVIQ